MTLDVYKLTERDYADILCGWWRDWGWEPPAINFLPEDGTGGLIVFEGERPICAGFLYTTNSEVAWVDWIISDKKYTNRKKRKEAITLLITHLTELAKASGFFYSYALIKHPSLIQAYEELGYTKGDSYQSEMIKIL